MQHSALELSRRQVLASLAALACSSSTFAHPRAARVRTGPDAQAFLDAVVAGDLVRVEALLAADPALARSVAATSA